MSLGLENSQFWVLPHLVEQPLPPLATLLLEPLSPLGLQDIPGFPPASLAAASPSPWVGLPPVPECPRAPNVRVASLYPYFLGDLIRLTQYCSRAGGAHLPFSCARLVTPTAFSASVLTHLTGTANLTLTAPSFRSPLPKSLQASLSSFSHT